MGGGGGCFVAGTKILVPAPDDGTCDRFQEVNIEELREGDPVISFNERLELVPARVVKTFHHGPRQVMHVETWGRHHPLIGTPSHFAYSENLGAFERLDTVQNMRSVWGGILPVVERIPLPDEQPVYNLTVFPNHTYIANGILVHNMGGGGGDDKGGTEVVSTTPGWLSDLGEWSSGKFKEQMGKQENFSPYPEMKNPYGQWESLFSKPGQSYLESFSAAPKAAYEQALTDTKNMFGARGLYGSVGSDLMSGAMASAGGQYATAMADAQQKAQNAQAMDYYTSAEGQKWLNQNAADRLNYENTMRQQIIGNYLASLGVSVPAISQGNVVVQDEGGGGGKGGGALGAVGQVAGMGMSMMCDRNAKTDIIDAKPTLERLASVPVYEYRYKHDGRMERHTGPMAQDWSKQFGGPTRQIHVQDMLGVLMKAVQELAAEVKQLKEATNGNRTDYQA